MFNTIMYLRLCPGSQTLYKYITILYFTSLPGVTIPLQVHHHPVLNVSAPAHNPSTRTSPYCTLRLWPGSQSFYMFITIMYLRLCPGSQTLYKYITILYFTSLPAVTILLQVHHHTLLYVSVRVIILLQVHHHTVLCVSARGHNPPTSTSPYWTLRLCLGSQSSYNCITILYFTSLPRVTIILHVHHHTVFTSLPGIIISLHVQHHTVLYVSARGHNPSTSTTPYCTLGLCPGSQSFYKYITILYFTSLPGVTILLQIHHHTVLYVSAWSHNHSASTSPYCTLRLCPGSQSFYKYITILYFTSLPGVTILPQVHNHTVLYVSARGHNPSTSTSPCCTLRICPGSQSIYNYITILYFTSMPGFTILLQLHHHTVLYVSAWGHNHSTSTSPFSTLRLYPGSQSSYRYITILYFTSLPGVTILLQVHHHHTVLNVSARIHKPSTSTSPYCTLRLCQGSHSF